MDEVKNLFFKFLNKSFIYYKETLHPLKDSTYGFAMIGTFYDEI